MLQDYLPGIPTSSMTISLRTALRKLFNVFYRTRFAEIITGVEVFITLGILKLDISSNKSEKIRMRTVVLAAPDGGNIGDRMMLLSVLNKVDGPCRIFSESSAEITLLPGRYQKPETVQIKDLYHRIPSFGLPALLKFGRQIRHSSSVLIIGADLMDGKYNYIASLHRLQLLHLANRLGVQTKVLGFSWGEELENSLISYIKNHCEDTKFCLRDPISKYRLDKLGVKKTFLTSDLVFSLPLIIRRPMQNYAISTHPYCVINGSGLISNSPRSKQVYVDIIKKLIDRDFHIFLIPHVIRNTDNDLRILSSIYQEFHDSGQVVLINNLLSPQELIEYCAGASLVLTSRMHLAILSLLSGTPPITFASHGKVEGLLRYFGLDHLCVSEILDSPENLSKLVDRYLLEFNDMKVQISKTLPHVIQVSSSNFE